MRRRMRRRGSVREREGARQYCERARAEKFMRTMNM
jgi:hypothetical protein